MISTIALYPPARIRKLIDASQWEVCLETWIKLLRRVLRQNDRVLVSDFANNPQLISFLLSYINESPPHETPLSSAGRSLQRNVFRVVHRLLSMSQDAMPKKLLNADFLTKLALAYHNDQVRELLITVYEQHGSEFEIALSTLRADMVSKAEKWEELDALAAQELDINLRAVTMAVMMCPDLAEPFLLGSDFMGAISSLGSSGSSSADDEKLRTDVSHNAEYLAYVLFIAALQCNTPKYSAIVDQLFELTEIAPSDYAKLQGKRTFLTNIVSRTPLLKKLERLLGNKASSRSDKALEVLRTFHKPGLSALKVPILSSSRQLRLRKESKAKKKDDAFSVDNTALDDGVRQLMDLFPGIDPSAAARMLEENGINVETVTVKLLDNDTSSKKAGLLEESDLILAARHDLDPSDDASRGQLHLGRRDQFTTAETFLDDKRSAPSKQDMLKALASMDSDEDERDDTYDAADVGGLVDADVTGDSNAGTDDKEDMLLYHALTTTPQVFNRSAETRRGNERAALRKATGMTDESIEGWKIMLDHDKRRQSHLNSRYQMWFREQNNTLSHGMQGSDSDAAAQNHRRTGGGGGGGGRGGRGGGNASKAPRGGKSGRPPQKSAQTTHKRKAQRFRKGGNPVGES